MKKILLLIVLLVFPKYLYALNFFEYYSKAEKVSNEFYPKLKSYKCDVKTSQFDIMMKKMTSSMPPDMPRPERPHLKKYWHYKKGMAIVLEGKNVFPYMQDFSKKMVSQFALELNGYFLPIDKKKIREELLKKTKNYVEIKNESIFLNIEFDKPAEIDNIFYKGGLPLPTEKIKSISFQLDKETNLIKKMVVKEMKDNKEVIYELSTVYERRDKHNLLTKLILTTDDNSIKAEFYTEFGKFNGYYLPVKQIRIIDGKDIPEEQKNITVEFSGYLLNKNIPSKVYANR